MSALSMKGKEKGRKILRLFRVYFYIVVDPAYRVFVLLHLKHLCLKTLMYANAIGKKKGDTKH